MASPSELSIPDKLLIPDELLLADKTVLPDLDPELIDELLNKHRWSGVGVALAIFDSKGQLMISEHKVTTKNRQLSWGPNSETVQKSPSRVEHLLTTAERCIEQELGIKRPDDLGLRDLSEARWSVSHWARPGKDLLAITLPFHIPDESRDHLLSVPPNTEEIARVRFLPADQVLDIPNLRHSTPAWIDHLGSVSLLTPQIVGELARFPGLAADMSMQDTDLILVGSEAQSQQVA